MQEPADHDEPAKQFLDVKDAEIVHGPDVIADKVSGALKDADRFGLPRVKPPLSEALDRVEDAGAQTEATGDGNTEQDALSGNAAQVDEKAGSAEVLKPTEKAGSA